MLIQGDSRFLPLTDNSVQCVVTSPPYWGLRDYGIGGQLGLESSPEEYVTNMVAVFREVWRVLRDDGTCWVNLGDSYARDPGKGDRAEYLGLHKNIADSGCHHASQFRALGNLKPKDLVGIPWRVAFALQADGWYLRSDIIWSKPNPMPESVTDRPTKAHEYIFLLSKRERYYFDQGAVRGTSVTHDPRRPYTSEGAWQMDGRPHEQRHGGKVRSPAGWKTGAGAHGSIHENGREREVSYVDDIFTRRNIRTVWTIATQPYSEAHFATFPEALAKRCILAGCPVGGVVLDPFAGSGTTVKVAQDLGRVGVGVDLKPDYLQMACKRSAQQGLRLEA